MTLLTSGIATMTKAFIALGTETCGTVRSDQYPNKSEEKKEKRNKLFNNLRIIGVEKFNSF